MLHAVLLAGFTVVDTVTIIENDPLVDVIKVDNVGVGLLEVLSL